MYGVDPHTASAGSGGFGRSDRDFDTHRDRRRGYGFGDGGYDDSRRGGGGGGGGFADIYGPDRGRPRDGGYGYIPGSLPDVALGFLLEGLRRSCVFDIILNWNGEDIILTRDEPFFVAPGVCAIMNNMRCRRSSGYDDEPRRRGYGGPAGEDRRSYGGFRYIFRLRIL